MRLSGRDIARLRSHVVVTAACDIWMGAVGSDGYGRYSITNREDGDRIIGPHIVAAVAAQMRPMPVGSTVLHDCDVRVCVAARLGHVRIGTQAENMAQAVRRGRARGPRPGAVDTRGKRGASVAVQDAIRVAVTAGVTDPEELARVLSDALAEGDPYRQLVPLFGEPDRVGMAAWDEFPVDLFDLRAAPSITVQPLESLPLF